MCMFDHLNCVMSRHIKLYILDYSLFTWIYFDDWINICEKRKQVGNHKIAFTIQELAKENKRIKHRYEQFVQHYFVAYSKT